MESIRTTVFLLLTLCITGHATVFDQDVEQKLKSYIDVSMKCRNIPGMTLSVVKGDEVWSQGFGKSDIARGKMVDSDTRFEIGSVTKAFTATLLGILLSENGYNWTTKVTEVLKPGYEFVDDYRTKEMTVRDLLSHRTGLARLDLPGLIAGIPKSISRTEFCKRMKYLPEERPIRDGFIYNNYMFMMAGHMAEVLGQDTWENLMITRVLQPIGMNDTRLLIDPSSLLMANTAQPYIYHDGGFQNATREVYSVYPEEPAGAILSSASDMAKWIKFHLNLGKTESGHQLISKKLVLDMHRVTTPLPSGPTAISRPNYPVSHLYTGYGYGWGVGEYRGFRVVEHAGGLGAFSTYLSLFPDRNIGIFFSTNGPGFGMNSTYHSGAVVHHLSDYLLGLDPWLNETTACSYPEPWGKKIELKAGELETPITVTNLAELEGSYKSRIFPDIDISYNSTDLLFTANKIHGILHASSEKDRFLFELLYPLEYSLTDNQVKPLLNVTFSRDATSQSITKLTLKMEVDVEYEKRPDPKLIG